MANIKSQIKRIGTNEKARLRNKAVKSSLKTHVRRFRAAADAGSPDAPELLRAVIGEVAYALVWSLGTISTTLTPTWYSEFSQVQCRTSASAMNSVRCMRRSEPGDKKQGTLSFRLDVPTSRIRACTACCGRGLKTSMTVSPVQIVRISLRRSAPGCR